ncbi:MAG: DUF3147 family protein [Candidatus Electryonea clarkiae]|nr:DUF3147 family protein [Candidatus Electryonea clarkiae]MDP8286760.1 DUF3147 family protein [Candidatus Electryonea clarkiae]
MKHLYYFLVGGCTVAAALWLSEKIGGKVGGIISTAPTVVLVAYIIFSLQKGVEESSSFAYGSVRGILATGIFMLILGFLPSSISLTFRLLISGFVWTIIAILLAIKI